jgi:hypothetical protein
MAIQSNPSDQAVTSGLKLFTGIGEFKVVAVNPTLEQLHEMNVMLQSEPKYDVEINGADFKKVVFWLKNDDVVTSCEILVTPGEWVSQTGKVKCYNRIGQDQWLEKNADGSFDSSNCPDWIKETETFYSIPRGMDTVTEFVKAWANVESGGEIKLDTVNKIANGDVKELRELIKALDNNLVRVLVYVRDGKYQAVYTRHFGRVNPKRNDLFIKEMNKDYGAVKGEYTLEWQKYEPSEIQADASAPALVTEGSDWEDTGVDPFGDD